MIKTTCWKSVGASFAVFMLLAGESVAKEDVKSVSWSPHVRHGCQMNMGPTGVKAWMRGYQFEVVTIDEGSPADGVLLVGDRVIGVGKEIFTDDSDSRMTLGNAIGEAEADDGELDLIIRRDGRKRKVTVKLPVTGEFSETWPYGCSKSQRILHEACVYLREAQFPKGHVVTDGGIGTFLSGLLFLASGEARFMDSARRAAYATAEIDFEKLDTANWAVGYGGVLLGEYYLATGDTNVLEKLQWIVDKLEMGQMQYGSWGHGSPPGGYGGMNQAGIVCAMALSLAHESGLDVDPESLRKALHVFGRYAELGAVSYGDHPPSAAWPDDNGKNSSSSVLCSLHPELQRTSKVFAESVALSYWMRETGHTGGFFGLMWGPLAARMADGESFSKFMDYQKWYYNLARTWKGSMVMLPYKEALTRFDDATYTAFGGEFTTGGFGLAFAIPHKKLRILGAPRSVFGAKVKGPVADARKAYMDRNWAEFDKAISKRVKGKDDKRWMAQLKSAKQQLMESRDAALAEIENYLNEKDPYRASEMMAAITREIGADDPAFTNLAARLEDGSVAWTIAPGERYYEAFSTVRSFAFQSWFPYANTAWPLFGAVPKLRPLTWDVILPAAGDEHPIEWDRKDGFVVAEREFDLDALDFEKLRVRVRAPRNSHTLVMLNGKQVAEVTRGQRYNYAKIDLDESALLALRKGKNVISVRGTSVGSDKNLLDVGLDGVPVEAPLESTPELNDSDDGGVSVIHVALADLLEKARERAGSVELKIKPTVAIPERVQVRDSYDRFKMALAEVCDEMDDELLDIAMHSPIAFWRYEGASAMARRGSKALDKVKVLLKDDDWRARSAACDALSMMKREGEGKDADHPASKDDEIVSRVSELTSDKNAWVRARAAKALGSIGRNDKAVASAVAKAVTDSDPWVRREALGAIGKVTDDSDLIVRSASDCLKIHSSAFRVTKMALGLIESYGPTEKSVIPSLVFAIENPGQGMAAACMNDLMTKLVELDPSGEISISLLAKVAEGGYLYDHLRGNPRQTAITLLGQYGDKASEALPVLEKITNSDEKRHASCKEAAKASIDMIVPSEK